MRARHTRIHDIFMETFALPPEERATAINRLCEGDPDLLKQVNGLLEASQKTVGFLESPLIDLATMEEDHIPPEVPGYKVQELLGTGGMAVVYKARQLQPDRIIALKLMKKGHGQELALRFQSERETLARMNHPWIAQIYDVGSSADGTPFFAMEYVEGCSITDYCKAKAPGLEQRLELFLKVCNAVEHAHGKLIIHRDLKPTNILVSEDGNPKIIDFGIARVLEPGNDVGTEITVQGGFAGTPIFMSPEQTQLPGSELDVRTDVYALGALLYLLVTGLKPFSRRTKGKPLDEVFSIIRNQTAHKPSRVLNLESPELQGINPDTLKKSLVEDLDWVILKALAKEREERYTAVGELAGDVKRFLDHRPVLARDPTGYYRFKRLVRRHRRPFWLSVTALVLVIGMSLTSAIYFYRALHAEKTAASYSSLLEEMMSSMDPRQDKELKISEHLDLFSARVNALSQVQPEAEAVLRTRLGSIYLGLGQYTRAGQELDVASRLSGNTLGPAHANSLLASYQLGILSLVMNDYEKAATLFQETLALQEKTLGPMHPTTLRTRRALTDTKFRTGTTEDLGPIYRKVLADQTRVLGEDHSETLLTATNLAHFLHEKRHFQEAETLYLKTFETRFRVLGARHPYTLNSMNARANNLFYLERYEEALGLARKAYKLYKEVLGRHHSYTLSCATNLANILGSLEGHSDEAEEIYREALDLRSKFFGEDHIETLKIMNNLSDLLMKRDKLPEARELKSRELDVLAEKYGKDHPETLFSNLTLGEIMIKTGEYAEAVELLADTCRRFEESELAPKADTALANGIYAYALLKSGRYEQAEELLRNSYALLSNQRSGYLTMVRDYMTELAESYEASNKMERAKLLRAVFEEKKN